MVPMVEGAVTGGKAESGWAGMENAHDFLSETGPPQSL